MIRAIVKLVRMSIMLAVARTKLDKLTQKRQLRDRLRMRILMHQCDTMSGKYARY